MNTFEIGEDPLATLALADPDLAAEIQKSLVAGGVDCQSKGVRALVRETLTAMCREVSFGRAVAKGGADLLGEVDPATLGRYWRLIRDADRIGPTLGRIIATYLVPVLKTGENRLLSRFQETVDILRQKGTYTLEDPLSTMAWLLSKKDLDATGQYLGLLCDTFSQPISYNQCQHFALDLPRSVRRLDPGKRFWQILEMRRVVQSDVALVAAFIRGLSRGTRILTKPALAEFVSLGLERANRRRHLGQRFLALESSTGGDTFSRMQVTVTLSQIQSRLSRYVQARVGGGVTVCPLSDLPGALALDTDNGPVAGSDGRFIYLPDEIGRFENRWENIQLYKVLTKLETGLYEFGTFHFDLEKALIRINRHLDAGQTPSRSSGSLLTSKKNISDLDRFFGLFPDRRLAADLFTVFEHGRLRLLTSLRYPGLDREAMPLLVRELPQPGTGNLPDLPLQTLYNAAALGLPPATGMDRSCRETAYFARVIRRFEDDLSRYPGVETCAVLTAGVYGQMATLCRKQPTEPLPDDAFPLMATPFGRRIRPELTHASLVRYQRIALEVKEKLAGMGVGVFKSDLVRGLVENRGTLSNDDLKEFARRYPAASDPGSPNVRGSGIDISRIDLSGFFPDGGAGQVAAGEINGNAFRYREWDHRLGDYLRDHVRVADRRVSSQGNGFYGDTLKKHGGLVKTIRFAFELLRPEGLAILRRWVEGDAFDYRALLDFAIDKKIGRMPSDRLYTKRLKQVRDVAVLLLMDLSRSTANEVPGDGGSVLDVEKEAVVLLCEALHVVGDTFAIAGFSGTGRLGVDYFRIKDFDEPMGAPVKGRLGAVVPHRNTRMGAAIRHATAQFKNIAAKVRLLMILGDGFPNDADYKRGYAIEDTRKAILEAAAVNIHTHAITVNLGADGKLDDLYGHVHYSLISDVRELPDKLPAIYGTLTKL